MTDADLFALVKNPPPRRAGAQLSLASLARIRALFAAGVTGKQLAARFGVDRSTISNIVHRRGGYA